MTRMLQENDSKVKYNIKYEEMCTKFMYFKGEIGTNCGSIYFIKGQIGVILPYKALMRQLH